MFKNNNYYWRDAIEEKIKKIVDAFQKHDDDPTELIGWKKLTCHMVYDIKISENFYHKAKYVADGHKTEAPVSVTYSSVVSRDSVRICLTAAALNDLKVLFADIENAYLNAPCAENGIHFMWTWVWTGIPGVKRNHCKSSIEENIVFTEAKNHHVMVFIIYA